MKNYPFYSLKFPFFFILIFFVITTFLSCTQSAKEQEPQLSNTFTTQEMIEVNKLIQHFDTMLTNDTNTKTIDVAYRTYFSIYRDSMLNFGVILDNDFCFAKDILSKKVKDQFFVERTTESLKMNYKTKKRENFAVNKFTENPEGQYIKFLNAFANHSSSEPFIIDYWNSFERMGTITSPSSTSVLLKVVDEVDFSIPEFRLIYIVHFIVMDCDRKASEELDALRKAAAEN